MSPRATGTSGAWDALVETCAHLPFEPHDIAAQLDARGRYEVPLDEEFAFSIKLFHYSSRQHTRGATWHERLELFVPLDGRTLFRMGDRTVELAAGDLLVVDNLTLHHVVDFPGFDTRAIVVSFRPEFVYSLGSPSYDYAFLLPFYSRGDRGARVLALRKHAEACPALRRLVECRFGAGRPDPARRLQGVSAAAPVRTGSPVSGSELMHWEFIRQQQRSLRLKALFDHVREHSADRLTVAQAPPWWA